MGRKEQPYVLTKRSIKTKKGTKKVYYYKLKGNNKRYSTGQTNKSDAIEVVNQKLKEQEEKVDSEGTELITFGEWIDPFYTDKTRCPHLQTLAQEGKELSHNTIHTNTRLINKWVFEEENNLKDKYIKDITTEDLLNFFNNIFSKGLSASELYRFKAIINLVFRYAYELGYIKENPMGRVSVRQPKQQYKTPIIETNLLYKLFDNITDPEKPFPFRTWEWKLYFYTLSATGMRSGEGFVLKWKDFDFQKNQVKIRRNLQYIHINRKELVVGNTKNHKERVAPMPSLLKEALLTHMNRLNAESVYELQRGAIGDSIKDFEDCYVFFGDNGFPWYSQLKKEEWHKAFVNLGFTQEDAKKYRPHSLRHTLNSKLILNNVNPVLLRHSFGWSNAKIQEIYTSVKPDDILPTAKQVNQIFSPLEEPSDDVKVQNARIPDLSRDNKIKELEQELEQYKKSNKDYLEQMKEKDETIEDLRGERDTVLRKVKDLEEENEYLMELINK